MADIRVPNSERCPRVLEQTPGILRSLLWLATPEQLDWRPSSELWSIAMVLAHLAEVEVKGFRSRYEAMLETTPGADRPLLQSYDQLALFRSGSGSILTPRWRALKKNAPQRWRCCRGCRTARANGPANMRNWGRSP